jgi:ribosomal protein S18 acetylase RimI-like enzyme
VTAAALTQRRKAFRGIRPVNPRKDMGAVADLIQEAFGHEMDPVGDRLVREMRACSQAGFLGWLIGRFFLPQAAYPMGFVWEEDKRVVGNASLLRVEGFPSRWVMANVAVAPAYQGRGIGRSLIQASMDFAQQRNAQELILQAESSNQIAQVLYASLGFRPLCTRTIWHRNRKVPYPSNLFTDGVRLRGEGEWKDQLSLAQRLHPEGLIWPYPLTTSLFYSSGLSKVIFLDRDQHWVWFEGHRLLGSLTARSGTDPATLRFILIVDPEVKGEIERPLLCAALAAYANRQIKIVLDYSAGIAHEELLELGFQPQRTLTWMAKTFKSFPNEM